MYFLPAFPRGGRFVYHRICVVCLQTDKNNVYVFTKLWGRSNEAKSWNIDSLDWVHFIWYPSVQKRIKYAICMPSCEASVAISVTNENDLQLSSKYLLYILEKGALNRLQIYLRSDCMGYQCHIWTNTLITKFVLKLHYLGCFRVVYAQAWHPHNVYIRWNRKRKWGPGENPRVDVVKLGKFDWGVWYVIIFCTYNFEFDWLL